MIDLRLPGGPGERPLTTEFPQKGSMILQRTMPPLLETPMAVFDEGVFTPNDRFYVRWHWGSFPTAIDAGAYRLTISGQVNTPLSLSLPELLAMPRVEVAAINQCAGNSRGLFEPRVAGAQWGHGAMGNARWTGVRLKDVLARAGVKAGAVAVQFGGLDEPLVEGAPDYLKSLDIDHALAGEVMLAFAMNGEPLPLLNGFPLRLVVPGWFSTYWMKMLATIEVLPAPDTNFWMAKAYRLPSGPGSTVAPGASGYAERPISTMVPRAFVTNLADGATLPMRAALPVRGLAMGGDASVKAVEISTDGGRRWQAAALGADEGRYSFRRFEAVVAPGAAGPMEILARCTNMDGATQPMAQTWNPGGYSRGGVERLQVSLA